MHLPIAFLILLASLTALLVRPTSSGKADDWTGPLVLKVNGKDVTLDVSSSSFSADEEERAVGFFLDGVGFVLSGDFDLNGDGKADENDKPKRDAQGKLDPKSLLNKRVLLHAAKDDAADLQPHVELPGLGDCDVLSGSTAMVTNYKKTGREVDRWSGTVTLNLKSQKGANPLKVTGRFECGIRPE